MTRALAPALAVALAGCSAADNLTYAEITRELDAIVRIQGSGADRRLDFADRAEVSAWYMRSPFFVPVRQALGFLLGGANDRELENPSRHVRELLRELPDEADADLARCADATARLLWIVELDPSPANRTVALDGACALLDALGLDCLDGPPEEIALVAAADEVEAARAGILIGRPAGRQAASFDDAARGAYRAALERIVARPLELWLDRIALVGDLLLCWQQEGERELRAVAAATLRRAMSHAVRAALLRVLSDRDPGYANVRLCAMQQLRRIGGPAAVPLLLAVMAAPAAGTSGITERFDQDPLVRLRLIHLCGQLRGPAAERAVRLVGREEWDTVAPVDFLAQTVLAERAYYSRLRVPALTALSLCLGRPRLDYGVEWVEAWYRERHRGS